MMTSDDAGGEYHNIIEGVGGGKIMPMTILILIMMKITKISLTIDEDAIDKMPSTKMILIIVLLNGINDSCKLVGV